MSYDGEGLSGMYYTEEYYIREIEVTNHLQEKYTIQIKTLPPEYRNVDDCIGRMLWEGEILLGNMMSEIDVRNKSILEVGAGVGFASFCCKGASDIIITDYLDDILEVESDNIMLNSNVIQNVSCMKLDWFNPQLEKQFDYIIGSEIFYTKELVDPLMKTISTLLKPNGKCIIINNVSRYLNCEKEYEIAIQKYHLHSEITRLSEGNVGLTYNKYIITLDQ